MWRRSVKIANCKLFRDLSPNMLHNIDGPTCWRSGHMESSGGWPNLWFDQTTSDFPQLPLLPLQTMVCSTLPSNFLTIEFKQIACWSLNLNSMNHANSPCALHALLWINLHTLYSLHSFKFLWTYILIGTPCYLSNWLMWYNWMNRTMLFLAKYLGFLFKKNCHGLSPQIENSYQSQKLDFHAETLICSLTLLWVFSNSLTLVRDLSYSHDQDHVHVHSHTILLH